MRANVIRSTAFVAASLCAITVLRAEPPLHGRPPQTQLAPSNSMIAGRVIEAASGQGVSSATVTLLGDRSAGRGAANRSVLTDTRGRFVFPAIGAGRYQIRIERVGFWSAPITTFRSIELGAAESITDLTMPLHRYGSISGTVTDENGDPVTGMIVAGFRRGLVNGQVAEIAVGNALTDDRGVYRMLGLKAGEYFVCACARPPIPFDGVLLNTLASQPAQLIAVASRALRVGSDVAAAEGMRTYAPAFHPSASSVARAAKITIADGEHRLNVDVQTPIVYAARVSGTVVGTTGTFNAAMLRLRPVGSPSATVAVIQPMLVQPNGQFDFAAVPAGEYSLEVTAPTVVRRTPAAPSGAALAFIGGRGASGGNFGQAAQVNEPIAWARVPVTIVDRDLTGLNVVLRPALSVSGVVEWPTASANGQPAPAPRSVQLLRLTQEGISSGAVGEIKPDGTFSLANGQPGKYILTVNSAFQIVKALIGETDITDMPVLMDDRDLSEVKITLANPNRPVLQGSVTGETSGGLTLLVFPAATKLWTDPMASSRWFGSTAVSRTGAFKFSSSLPPGEYFVAAVPDDEGVDWQMPSRLEALSAKAQKITIAKDEMKTIEVRR